MQGYLPTYTIVMIVDTDHARLTADSDTQLTQ